MNENAKIGFDILWKNLILILFYEAAAIIARTYIGSGSVAITPIFPSTGIAFAAILGWGLRVLPGLWLAAFFFTFALSHNIFLSVIVGAGNVLQAYFSVWILQKLSHTKMPFYNPYNVAVFTFGSAFLGCLISSTIGVTTYLLFHHINLVEFGSSWASWWLADSIGIISMGSVIMVWAFAKTISISYKKAFELGLVLILLFSFLWLEHYRHLPLVHLLLPLVIWSTIRFGPQITLSLCFLLSIIVFEWSISWYYEFYGISPHKGVLFAQSFAIIIFFVSFMLNALLAEREKVKQHLIRTYEELENRVVLRSQALAEKNSALRITITDLKEAQAHLVQAEKMSALGVLTAGIAHEINNSVNFISATIGPLKNDIVDLLHVFNKLSAMKTLSSLSDKLAEIKKAISEINLDYTLQEIEKLLAGIQEGAERTTTVVKDLRTFSHLDAGEFKKIDIQKSIDATLNLLKSTYVDRITIIKNYATIPEVECYPGKLNQVIMNLLTNAIQAIPGKGVITITTIKKENEINLSIKDTGTGIAKEIFEKIFEPFFTTKEVGKGTGLGLSISYGIIQEHHGTMSVESNENGSEFTVHLPISQETKQLYQAT
jgi:two-component system NtrC family sensor kinase